MTDWVRGFERYIRSGDQRISHGLVRGAAQDVFKGLASSQTNTMLLHGDLQSIRKVLSASWTTKSERCSEIPIELPDLFTNRATIEGRVEILTTLLPLDRTRLPQWSFAQAVLSAIWNLEDGGTVESPPIQPCGWR